MTTEELISYIKQQISSGYTKEQISEALVDSGWGESDIEEAFNLTSSNIQIKTDTSTQVSSRTTEGTHQKKVDLYAQPRKQPTEKTPPEATSKKHESRILTKEDVNNNGGKHTAMVIVVSLLVVALLSAGGAYAYFALFNKMEPYEVFKRTLEASSEVTSNRFSSDISIEINAESTEIGAGELSFKIVSSGAKSTFRGGNPKIDVNFNIDLEASSGPFIIKFGLDADLRVLDKILYMRVNSITDLPAFVPIDLSSIKGEWFKVDMTEVENAGSQFGLEAEDIEDILEENKEKQEEFLAGVASFFDEIEQIVNRSTTEGEDKKIDGVSVYHYIVKVSESDLRRLFDKVIEIAIEVLEPGDVNIVEIEEFKKSKEFDQFLSVMSKIETEMWIGKKDFLIYKSTLGWSIDNVKIDKGFLGVGGGESTQDILRDAIKAEFESIASSMEEYHDSENGYGPYVPLGSCPDLNEGETAFAKDFSTAFSISYASNIAEGKALCVATGGGNAQAYAISLPFDGGTSSFCVDSSGFIGDGEAGENAKCKEHVSAGIPVDGAGEVTIDGSIKFTYSASDYNESVTVEVPEGATSILDFVEGSDILGLNAAREKGRQASIKANLASLRVSAELFYDDYDGYGEVMNLGNCPENGVNNTMFSQDENITNGIDQAKENGNGEAYCVADSFSDSRATVYAISVPFKDGDDGWCVDSSGFFGNGEAGENGACVDYLP